MIEIIRLEPEDWQLYRALRLEALQTDPQAFGSTYENTLARPESFWRQRLAEAAQEQDQWMLFARLDGRLVGMTGAYLDHEHPDMAWVISVYVQPAQRGKGISRLLMSAILDKLKARGLRKARLGVVKRQIPALSLYRSFGFEVVGSETNIMGHSLAEDEYIMEKVLAEE